MARVQSYHRLFFRVLVGLRAFVLLFCYVWVFLLTLVDLVEGPRVDHAQQDPVRKILPRPSPFSPEAANPEPKPHYSKP